MDSINQHQWLLSTVRASSSSNAMPNSGVYSSDDPFKHDENFQRLIQGVYFTRRLMISYHIVLVAVVLIFACRYWISKQARRERLRQRLSQEKFASSASSASSSTYVTSPSDANTTTAKLPSEDSPLLPSEESKISPQRLRLKVRSWLMYQPRPLPVLGKDLPSNATSMIILLLFILELFYLFFGYRLEKNTIFLFGDRCGALFVGNLPWLYILSAKNQPVKLLTGFSYESLNILHRRLGEILCLLAVFHLCAMVGVWYTMLYPVGWSLAKYLSVKIVVLGLCAFVCYQLLYLTSLRSFRNRFYEVFLFLHVNLQMAALILVYLHHPQSRVLVPIAGAFFLADRIIFDTFFKTRIETAHLRVAEDENTVIMTIPVRLKALGLPQFLVRLLPLSIHYGWESSQHIQFTVLNLGFQPHPFSVASSQSCGTTESGELELIIRAQRGFSRKLLEHAKLNDSVSIVLRGPYGSVEALNMMKSKDTAIVFAAGSGIAVGYSICRALVEEADRQQATTTNYRSENLRKQKVCLVWVIREQSNVSWITDKQWKDLRDKGIDVTIPEPTLHHGRPNCRRLLEKAVEASLADAARHSVGVVCSGPDSVNRNVRNAASSLAAAGIDIDIAVEKYGW